MRKWIVLVLVLAVAPLVRAQVGRTLVKEFTGSLLHASSLTVHFTYQVIGGVPGDYNIQLSKPNLAKIDTPAKTIVADGQNVTTYYKDGSTYVRIPETAESLNGAMSDPGLNIWLAFFDPHAMEDVPEASITGHKSIGGVNLTELMLVVDSQGNKTETLFLDPQLGLKKVEINMAQDHSTALLSTSNCLLGTTPLADGFTNWSLPAGAQQLTPEEIKNSRWHDNMGDATEEARATNKLILLLFVKSQSALCDRLAHELFPMAAFKKQSQNFVFCVINVDNDKALAAQYQITQTPMILFLKPDQSAQASGPRGGAGTGGKKLGQTVGYSGTSEILAAMADAVTANAPPKTPGASGPK